MKRSLIGVFLILLISVFSFSCKKDNEVRVIITVKLASDTTVVVPFAYVNLYKYDVNVLGETNVKGEFEHVFPNEAILDVKAWTVNKAGQEELSGTTTVVLLRGKPNRKTVFIK